MRYILNPSLFNWLILALFAFAAIRWAIERDWIQAGYWGSALLLNVFVTMMAGKA